MPPTDRSRQALRFSRNSPLLFWNSTTSRTRGRPAINAAGRSRISSARRLQRATVPAASTIIRPWFIWSSVVCSSADCAANFVSLAWMAMTCWLMRRWDCAGERDLPPAQRPASNTRLTAAASAPTAIVTACRHQRASAATSVRPRHRPQSDRSRADGRKQKRARCARNPRVTDNGHRRRPPSRPSSHWLKYARPGAVLLENAPIACRHGAGV